LHSTVRPTAIGSVCLIFNTSRTVSRLSKITEASTARACLKDFSRWSSAGHEIEKALDGADIIYAVGPAYSTRPFAEACRPYLKKGQIVIVCPSSCGGAIEFKNGAGLDLRDEGIVVAETSTLPYAVRLA
jgi:opine dehydrogenase